MCFHTLFTHVSVVLLAGQDRLSIAKKELLSMLNEEELKDAILLIFANKQVMLGCFIAFAQNEIYFSQM